VVDTEAPTATAERISSQPPRAASAEERLLGGGGTDDSYNAQISFYPEARGYVFTGNAGTGVYRLYEGRLGGAPARAVTAQSKEDGHPAVSPDGRWLAYASDESGTSEIYVRPFPDAASARWQVSTAGGTSPVWSHSGKELFYRSNQDAIMTVAVHPGSTFSFDPPKRLFSTEQYIGINPVPSFDVSPDDKRFLLLRETAPNERNELIVVQNWTQEMKARARK
jgi:hypothetical protein